MTKLAATDRLQSFWAAEKKRILIVLFATFVWGLLAHGYAFANLTISHDSLNELYLFGDIGYSSGGVLDWKISLGRFGTALYRLAFHGLIITPWLCGMLALLWLAVSCYITVHVLSIHRPLALILTAGVLTVNITTIAQTATYINELDANMFSVMAAALAVFFWKKETWWSLLLGTICVAVTLSIYQANVSMTITLGIFVCIQELLHRENFRTVFVKGLKAVAMMAVSAILYLLLAKLFCACQGIELSSGYNSLSNAWKPGERSLLWYLIRTYSCWIYAFIQPKTVGSSIVLVCGNVLFAAVSASSLVYKLAHHRTKGCSEILLLLALGALLPLGMNLCYVLNKGEVHDLMCYAFWLIYVLGFVLTEGAEKPMFGLRLVSYVLVFVVLWGNVQTANAAYLKKDLERQGTLSLMTRVVDCMEQTEGYVPGETQVVFIGSPNLETVSGFETLQSITGLDVKSTISGETFYYPYFEFFLQKSIMPCAVEKQEAITQNQRLVTMPCFPDADSIQMIDGVLVVKMS